MGSMMVSGISYFVQNAILSPMQAFLFSILNAVAQNSLTLANLPFVQNAETVAAGVAATLLVLRFSYEALTKYILWNEGTADPNGSNLWKGVARAAFFIAASTLIVDHVFQFGLYLAGALAAAPLAQAAHVSQGWAQNIVSAPGVAVGTVLFLVLFLVTLVIGLLIITIQMVIRAAELVFFVVGGPLAAVGQLSPDGGVWNGWWRSLIILSLAQAWQFLALKGLLAVATYPMIGSTTNGIAGFAGVTTTVMHTIVSALFGLGFVIVAIRGPHLLKEWAAHTGVGGAVGMTAQGAAREGTARVMKSLGGG